MVKTIMTSQIKIQTQGVNVRYGSAQALHGIDLDLNAHEVTALIGPSG